MRGGGEGMSKWILFRWGGEEETHSEQGNSNSSVAIFFKKVFLEKKVVDLWEDQKVPRQILRMN